MEKKNEVSVSWKAFEISRNKFKSGPLYKSSCRNYIITEWVGIISLATLFGFLFSLLIFHRIFLNERIEIILLVVAFSTLITLPISMSLILLLFKIFNPQSSGNLYKNIEDIYLEGYYDACNNKNEKNFKEK